ncbi:MAG: hypothetical protein ACKO9H_18275, partial [Planctomycetota bacterium]
RGEEPCTDSEAIVGLLSKTTNPATNQRRVGGVVASEFGVFVEGLACAAEPGAGAKTRLTRGI